MSVLYELICTLSIWRSCRKHQCMQPWSTQVKLGVVSYSVKHLNSMLLSVASVTAYQLWCMDIWFNIRQIPVFCIDLWSHWACVCWILSEVVTIKLESVFFFHTLFMYQFAINFILRINGTVTLESQGWFSHQFGLSASYLIEFCILVRRFQNHWS